MIGGNFGNYGNRGNFLKELIFHFRAYLFGRTIEEELVEVLLKKDLSDYEIEV